MAGTGPDIEKILVNQIRMVQWLDIRNRNLAQQTQLPSATTALPSQRTDGLVDEMEPVVVVINKITEQ